MIQGYIKSPFLIETRVFQPGKVLLFSTLAGKGVLIDSKVYQELFSDTFLQSDNDELSKKLIENKIVIKNIETELDILRKIRKETIKQYDDKAVSNYVITPTMNCNARCSYCFEHGSHHEDMNMKVADKVLEYILKASNREAVSIHWFGGEPLMNYRIIDYISQGLEAENISYVSKVTTNGYYLSESIVEKAVNRWNVQQIQITLDGIGEAYNKVKRYVDKEKADPFEHVMRNIEIALKAGINMRIRTNYIPEESSKVSEIMDYILKRFGQYENLCFHSQSIYSNIVTSISDSSDDAIHPIIRVVEEEEKFERERNRHIYSGANKFPETKFTPWCDIGMLFSDNEINRILCKYHLKPLPLHCIGVCDSAMAIDSLGDIYICHRLLGKGKAFSSGNVFDGLEKNEIYHFYHSIDIDRNRCGNCNLLPICQGGCKYNAANYKSQHSCISTKGCQEQALVNALHEIQQYLGTIDEVIYCY